MKVKITIKYKDKDIPDILLTRRFTFYKETHHQISEYVDGQKHYLSPKGKLITKEEFITDLKSYKLHPIN